MKVVVSLASFPFELNISFLQKRRSQEDLGHLSRLVRDRDRGQIDVPRVILEILVLSGREDRDIQEKEAQNDFLEESHDIPVDKIITEKRIIG